MNEVFLDTSFAVALAAPSDEFHSRSVRLARSVQRDRISLLTTEAILLEIGNALSRPPNRMTAVELITQLQRDPDTTVVPMTRERLAEATDMFAQFDDKTWGLVDCLSFLVMRERGIADALTADRHFQQAGFRALLLEDD